MQIEKKNDGSKLTIALSGRLDTLTAPALEEDLRSALDGVEELVIDLSELDYISSAGLRVMLFAHKSMRTRGRMLLKNVNPGVMDIFEMTGFAGQMEIEGKKA